MQNLIYISLKNDYNLKLNINLELLKDARTKITLSKDFFLFRWLEEIKELDTQLSKNCWKNFVGMFTWQVSAFRIIDRRRSVNNDIGKFDEILASLMKLWKADVLLLLYNSELWLIGNQLKISHGF